MPVGIHAGIQATVTARCPWYREKENRTWSIPSFLRDSGQVALRPERQVGAGRPLRITYIVTCPQPGSHCGRSRRLGLQCEAADLIKALGVRGLKPEVSVLHPLKCEHPFVKLAWKTTSIKHIPDATPLQTQTQVVCSGG